MSEYLFLPTEGQLDFDEGCVDVGHGGQGPPNRQYTPIVWIALGILSYNVYHTYVDDIQSPYR